ncbi:hypothetical protein Trydic_g13140 [Trypoxylus dichotomus]
MPAIGTGSGPVHANPRAAPGCTSGHAGGIRRKKRDEVLREHTNLWKPVRGRDNVGTPRQTPPHLPGLRGGGGCSKAPAFQTSLYGTTGDVKQLFFPSSVSECARESEIGSTSATKLCPRAGSFGTMTLINTYEQQCT